MEDKEVIAIQYRKISELEKENKNLNEERDNCLKEVKLCYNDIHSLEGQISDLEKENKNLKEENNRLKNNAMEDMRVQTKLEEEIRFLEQCLDNKEKVNKKLREDLGECECSMHFENDEVGFWKREYKRLKKWIKDHCKGYGNLFPEDEMKRQWKKADKKRK